MSRDPINLGRGRGLTASGSEDCCRLVRCALVREKRRPALAGCQRTEVTAAVLESLCELHVIIRFHISSKFRARENDIGKSDLDKNDPLTALKVQRRIAFLLVLFDEPAMLNPPLCKGAMLRRLSRVIRKILTLI